MSFLSSFKDVIPKTEHRNMGSSINKFVCKFCTDFEYCVHRETVTHRRDISSS